MKILKKTFSRTKSAIIQYACKSCACDAGCNCEITAPAHSNKYNSSKYYTNNLFRDNHIEFK